MVSGYQNGTIAQLLQAIIGQINFDGEPISNIGDILLSILEQTPYDEEPKSVLAELFLKLKDKLEGRAFTPYDKEPKSVIAEILLSILNETEYDKEPNSRIAELLLELKAELESYAEITVSGAIANFTTSVVKPLVNLKAYFKATQESGTPTPETPKAISGVSAVSVYHLGGNFFNKNTVESGKLINASGNETSYADWNLSDYIEVIEGSSYYLYGLTAHPNTNQDNFELFDASKNKVGFANVKTNEQPYTIPSGVKYIKCCVKNQDLDTAQFGVYQNLSYCSYSPEIEKYIINLGGTYYGGYVEQDKDGNRELVVTHEIIDLGDLSWTYRTDGTNPVFRAAVEGTKQYTTGTLPNIKTTCFEVVQARSAAGLATNLQDNQCSFIINGANFTARCDAYTDAPTFTNAMIGQKLVYELAEPFTVALPDGEPINAFNGVNNVYNDSGDTSVTYLAKIEDNLKSAAKFRANLKAEKQKLKEQKEQKELDVLEPVEDVKEIAKKGG